MLKAIHASEDFVAAQERAVRVVVAALWPELNVPLNWKYLPLNWKFLAKR
jgi:hypothetical protein